MKKSLLWLAVFPVLVMAPLIRAEVVLSEFMATNVRTLTDEDGSNEDWIELRNTGVDSVNVNGWFLTDDAKDLRKWQLPSTNLNAGGTLLIFASSKDRRLPGKPLHTNFKLSASGEYLALVKADGLTPTTAFAPQYPPQAPDVSYGFGLITTNIVLISNTSPSRVLVPTASNGGNVLGASWRSGVEPFNDSSWTSASGSVGFSGANATLVAAEALVVRFNFDAAPVQNVIVDSKPGGTVHNGVNKGADWNSNLVDFSPTPIARDGVMQFVATNSDQITLTGNVDFNSPQGTLGFWIRSTGNTGAGSQSAVVFERRTSAGGLWVLQSDDGRVLVNATGTANQARNTFYSLASVGDGRWHHVALNYDQTASGVMTLVVDGQPSGSGTNSAAWAWPATQTINLGRSQDTASSLRRFNGALDDVRLYNRSLTSAEVVEIYQGDGGIPPAQVGLNVESSMLGVASSAFVRIPFTVGDPSLISSLSFRVKADDGYALWLNGKPIVRSNSPDSPTWDSVATSKHSSALTETILQVALPGLLRAGGNVLSVQGLNLALDDPTFLIGVELSGFGILSESQVPVYFVKPTPGEVNGVGVKTPGPVILDVGHSPKVPADSQDVLVMARVLSSFNSVSNVTLRYRVMFDAEVALLMSDDGLHGDGAAGDGVYGAWIPASASTNGQMLRYAVTALDVAANASRWPLFNDPLSSEEYLGTVVGPDYVTSKLPVFHLFVSPQNLSKIDDESGGRLSIYLNGEFYDNVYMELRGNTSAGLPKKSHRVEFHRDQPLHHPGPGGSVQKTSFIAEHLDPTYMRQGLSFWLLNETGTPAPFYYPVRLQLNGAFYQLASHNDVLGADQLERLGYPRSGALYKAAGTVTPDESSTGGFEKKTREFESHSDYLALANAINEARGVATRRTNVFEFLDVPNVVNYLACARWVQEADDVWANMSLYRDSDGDKLWRVIPFDMNLSWGALYYGDAPDRNFGVIATDDDNKSHPLYGGAGVPTFSSGAFNRIYDVIISVPETRQMLLRRMRTIMDEYIQPPTTHPLLRKFERRISELTNSMWTEAFIDRAKWRWPSLSGPYSLGDNQWLTNATQELVKKFIEPRRNHFYVTHAATNTARTIGVGNKLNAGIPTPQPDEVIIQIADIDSSPSSGNQAEEYIQLTNNNPFAVDLSGWELGGAVQFKFHGGTVMPSNSVLYVARDLVAFRGRTSGPRGGRGLFVVGPYSGQLSARGEDILLFDQGSRLVTVRRYSGNPSLAQQYLRVTEIMYHPAPPPSGSPYRSSDLEFIELRNMGPVPLDLRGVHFTNGLTFNFSGSAVTNLAPGGITVVVKNRAGLLSRYGSVPGIAGEYLGSLANNGERITLHDAVGEVILDFHFQTSWFPATDGLGFSLVAQDPNAVYTAWDDIHNWGPSRYVIGSPGNLEPKPEEVAHVLINEVISNPAGNTGDAVELFNSSPRPADISGWFLSDDFGSPKKYRFPLGTVIGPQQFLVVRESAFNSAPGSATSFSLNASGDHVYLFASDTSGFLLGYFHGFKFGAAEAGVPFARYPTSTGEDHLVAEESASLGSVNSAPRLGPVVISEFLYNGRPVLDTDVSFDRQFIELWNKSSVGVGLFDPQATTNTWRMRGDADYDFPTNIVLRPDEKIVLVGFDPQTNLLALAQFKAEFGLSTSTRLFGPLRGNLGNAGGEIHLNKPNPPTAGGVDYVTVDEVHYLDVYPWPEPADGLGASLQRRLPLTYADDPASWYAAVPNPGDVSAPTGVPVIVTPPQAATALAQTPVSLSVNAVGSSPLRYQWLMLRDPVAGANQSTLLFPSVLPENAGFYSVVVMGSGGSVTSSVARLDVQLPSFFALQPQSRFVLAGTNVTFSATAVGTGLVRYQWRRDGVPISGATGGSLVLTKVQPSDSAIYDVVVQDDLGRLTSDPARLVVSIKPTFAFPPQALTVLQGENAVLFATVSGTPPLNYKWSKGGKTITNYDSTATSTVLVLSNAQPSLAGSYTLFVTNFGGTSGNASAVLTVLPDADRDGMADSWETQFGFDSANPADGVADLDRDGMSNRDEYVAGTNPNNAASLLSLQVILNDPGVALRFVAVSNHSYSLFSRSNLTSAAWAKVADIPGRATNRVAEVLDAGGLPEARFYRLVVPAVP